MTLRRRRTTILRAAVVIAAFVVPACDDDADAVRGSGTLASEERPVSGFDSIALEGSGDLIVDVGDTEFLTIEAEDNLLPLLTSDVSGSRLNLGPRESISPTMPITYTVGAMTFDGVSIAGSGDVVAADLDCATFDVSVAGSGTFDIAGSCDELDLSISGSGDFDGENLVIANARITINGTGDAVINVTDDLRVTINGSGDVVYIGDPSTDIDINGSGEVRQRQ